MHYEHIRHHHASGSLSTYYTLTWLVACLLSLRCYSFLIKKFVVCLCVQGVMQDVEILVMPQGYISQCPDLNRSECSHLFNSFFFFFKFNEAFYSVFNLI